jgi:immune inhibitor A
VRGSLVRRKSTRAAVMAVASAALLIGAVASPAPAGPRAARQPFWQKLQQAVPEAGKYPLTWSHPSHEPVSVAQPNGKRVQIVGVDMEHGGVSETVDGYSVVKNQKTGWWVYALKGANGWEAPTRWRVGVDTPPKSLPKHAARSQSVWIDARGNDKRGQVFKMLSQNQAFLQAQAKAKAAGARQFKIPALMLETFGPFGAESTPDYFKKLLSGTRDTTPAANSRGTMTELYLEMSWGQFEPIVDVFGPYKSALSLADKCFYGRKASPDTNNLTDTEPSAPSPANSVAGMALEAVPQADPAVDFSDYDNDGDGAVDFLLVIHSGPGREATLDDCHVHSHYFGLATAATTDLGPTSGAGNLPQTLPAGPIIIQSAMTIPEFGLQIGVAAHEFMHALGEPDYYDTDGTGEGTGEWDLGGGGPWLGFPPQSNSVHFNPIIKINLGWVKPRLVNGTTLGVALRPRELFEDLVLVPIKTTADCADPINSNFCFTIGGKNVEVTEGYLLEMNNRVANGKPKDPRLPRGGLFDRFTHANGLMVWHFDSTMTGNSDETHMRGDLEEADWRDGIQDVQIGLTRGDPRDLFYDDATGLSSATVAKKADTGGDGKAQAAPNPAGGWTVVSPILPCEANSCPSHPGAQPVPTWTVEDDADNIAMRVHLDWESNSADDWDLYVDRNIGGTWTQIASSAGGTDVHPGRLSVPQHETAVVLNPPPGEYRARAVNWLAPTQPQARISVAFQSAFDKGGMPNTLDWSGARSGWAFTNIRPLGDGVTVDFVRHTNATFDLSPEIVTTPEGLRAGVPGIIRTRVYNHGGKATSGVTLQLIDNGAVVATRSIAKIAGYDFIDVQFPYTTSTRGVHEFVTKVLAKAGEKVLGNNEQRGSLTVGDGNAVVLIVDDDQGFSLEESYAAGLAALGVPFAITGDHPSLAELKRSKAVIWVAGSTQRKNSVDGTDRANLGKYLDAGGRLLMTGARTVSGINAAGAGDWLKQYLGISHKDIWQYGTGPANGLGLRFHVDLAPGRSLMDEYGLDGGTETYKLDPEVQHEVEGLVGARLSSGSFKTEVTSFSLGQLRDAEARNTILKGSLKHLGIALGGRPADASPLVEHAAWRVRLNGQATPIIASVTDADGVLAVKVRYRKIGTLSWVSVPMLESTAAGLYEAMIPASAVTPAGFEYVIEATDAAGNTRLDPARGSDVVASAIGPQFGAYPSIVSPMVKGVVTKRPLAATGVADSVPLALAFLGAAMALAIVVRRKAL